MLIVRFVLIGQLYPELLLERRSYHGDRCCNETPPGDGEWLERRFHRLAALWRKPASNPPDCTRYSAAACGGFRKVRFLPRCHAGHRLFSAPVSAVSYPFPEGTGGSGSAGETWQRREGRRWQQTIIDKEHLWQSWFPRARKAS
ncbi:MAG: hypothetical protein KatS3mg058_4555 [Roseiflexus sp.]|jgi:hypothetical protein|nr:MAG: hypothetical protein KatS3mg058_4555 [Roseiflexus sp.]